MKTMRLVSSQTVVITKLKYTDHLKEGSIVENVEKLSNSFSFLTFLFTLSYLFALQISFTKEEVERIMKLPSELQLALPFLHNPEELYAHKILNHFSRNKGQ